MSDVVRTKKVAREARPCVLMIFLPAEETHEFVPIKEIYF